MNLWKDFRCLEPLLDKKPIISPLAQINVNLAGQGLLSYAKMPTCNLSCKPNGVYQSRHKIMCTMNITAGHSEGPWKIKLDQMMYKLKKLWDISPQPVKSFPWIRAMENFIQLILDLTLAVIKFLSIPVLTVTSISEMSYCAHEKKLRLVPLPLLLGVVVAGILKDAALELSPLLKNAEVPWHLIALGIFFTLLKLPGPYYPYWGRIFIPHLANGGLLRTLWFAFLWYKRPGKTTGATLCDTSNGTPE